MGAMQPWHWLIVILAFVLLFGAKKLPEMARSLGQSARVFKSEMKGMKDDDEARAKSTDKPAAQPAALPPAQSASAGPAPQAQATDGAGGSDAAR